MTFAIVVVVIAGTVVEVVDVLDVVVGATVVVVAGTVVVVEVTVVVVSALLLSSLHPAATSAAMQSSPTSVRRDVIGKVCQHNYRIRVSASWPPSTRCSSPSITSTTVTEQLSRVRMTTRSSPSAAPMTALMAMK